MLTRMAPMRAVANCSRTHCGTFVAQRATCSPVRIPILKRPRAAASTSSANCRQVQRRPSCGKTIASRSAKRRAVSVRTWPMVRPSTQGMESFGMAFNWDRRGDAYPTLVPQWPGGDVGQGAEYEQRQPGGERRADQIIATEGVTGKRDHPQGHYDQDAHRGRHENVT